MHEVFFFLAGLSAVLAIGEGVRRMIVRRREEPTTAMKVRAVQMAATQQNDRRDGETCKIGGRWK